MRTSLSMQETSSNIGSSGQQTKGGQKSKGKEKAIAISKGKKNRIATTQDVNNILGVRNVHQNTILL